MNPQTLLPLIEGGETMDIEFKGEERNALSDNDLVEAVVCLCNQPRTSQNGDYQAFEDGANRQGGRKARLIL